MGEQRLIDANALIRALIRKEPFSDCARVVIAECMEEVRHAPTIERKKGKWIIEEGKGFFRDVCSECGKKYVHTYPHFNYCPNCGSFNGGKEDE